MQARTRELPVNGPFDLRLALDWLGGFPPLGPPPRGAVYAAAHALGERPRLLRLWQPAPTCLSLEIVGDDLDAADEDAAAALVCRAFSLDADPTEFYGRVGAADPVLGELQARFRGLRPVLFPTPFEALCWAILAIRTAMKGAAGAKARLAALYGARLTVDGVTHQAFPTPEQLAGADPREIAACGIPRPKIPWLLALARRGATGAFDAAHLRALGADAARAWLQESPGIGPWASEFVLIRGVGYRDLLPREEGRLFDAVRYHYDLDHTPSQRELERLADAWAGWRSWAAFLLRAAYQADTGAPANPRARQ